MNQQHEAAVSDMNQYSEEPSQQLVPECQSRRAIYCLVH